MAGRGSRVHSQRTLSDAHVKLVLFDIDGTILLTDGAGRRAVHRALLEVFGTTGPDDHRFDGKTDPQIVRELMRMAGHADDHIDARMARLLERYVECLREELVIGASATTVMPGIPPLLDALHAHPDVVLGLLTGNVAAGARAKLQAAAVDPDRFRIGAYGSDSETRGDLPRVAQQRARDELGVVVEGHDVVVIGDTPADIQCGRSIGARSIAVATSHYSVDDLLAHDPSAVFEDFSCTEDVVRAILADSVGPGDARHCRA